jgi:HEAT repeat protein
MSTNRWTDPLHDALKARFSPTHEIDALLLRSESADGFEREGAVRALGALGNPTALPALIARANDWVWRVREAAVASLTQLAVPANAAAFVDCLPTFARLRNCHRAVHAPLIEQVERFVCRAENAHHVLAGIRSPLDGVATACLLLALQHRLADAAALVHAGLDHPDIRIRNRVAPLIAGLEGAQRRAALAAALADRSMPLRRAALTILLSDGETGIDFAGYLFDRHASVRRLVAGRLALQGVEVAAAYRTALRTDAAPARRCTALWGLGEYGSREDRPLIEPCLGDAAPAVRRQALDALVRRIGDDARPSLLRALADDTDAVANQAARACVQLRLTFDAAELLALLPDLPRDNLVRRLTRAHQVSNKWERLIFLLSVRRDSDEGRRQFASELRHWDAGFNRSFVQLTAAQTARLRDAMRAQPPASRGWPDECALASLHETLRLQGVTART